MILVDTHAHLYLEEFADDIKKVIHSAWNNHVKYMLLPNIDLSSVEPMLQLCNQYPESLYPMIGLHPTSVDADFRGNLEKMYGYLQNRPIHFFGVGEIGIDFYWDKTFAKEQETALRIQLQWAKEFALPVVLHTRNSFRETMNVLKSENIQGLQGVFHCFGGTHAEAEEIIELGFKIGIGGVCTFKNSGLAELIRLIDLKNIILETDSPYLSPVPYRGMRNESANILLIAQKVAEIQQISLSEVAETTTRNALDLFGFSN